MATSSSSLDKFHVDLRDINFWLHGYRDTDAYRRLPVKMYGGGLVGWNVGVGPAASFTRAISTIAFEAFVERRHGSFDPVIKVELKNKKPAPTEEARYDPFIIMSMIEYELTTAVAEELGLLDQDQQYKQLKKSHEELRYHTYGMKDLTWQLMDHMRRRIVPQINNQLSTKRYLLAVKNLYRPIEPGDFSVRVGLPPPLWALSWWFISTTSRDVCDKSKSRIDAVVSIAWDDEVVLLILTAFGQSAKNISNMMRQQGEQEHWHRIALSCFHYAMVLFAKHAPPKTDNGDHQGYNGGVQPVTSDELIHQWVAQGILMNKSKLQGSIDEETGGNSSSSKYHYAHQVGRVILEAFQEYSLLQLPFYPAHGDDEATKTAAQFLAYHSLVGEGITVDELFDDNELECKKWISFVGDHGWHVSRGWLSQEETSGPTALILRGCSKQSFLFSQINCFLPKLHFLRVLDLSYTPLKSLPPLIGCLLNLRLLSLRGCHDLKTLLIASSTTNTMDPATNNNSNSPLSTLCQLEILDMNGVPFSHLSQDMGNQKSNLIHLDMSYSQVTNFPLSFFQDMSNLEVLILVKCPNLVELPPSMVALLSLTTLEVTGTQIKSFLDKIFVEMKQLQSLKLIDNKLLISLPRSISEAQGLKELHILGCNELREAEVFGGARLKTVVLSGGMQWLGLPKSLVEEASHGCLEELHIEGWESTMVEEIKLDGHPTLKSFSLICAPHVRCLSLHGCRKLESVDLRDLGALEDLDLSATAIKELPVDIPNLPQLRRLLLMGVPSLRRFPWHKLQRLPEVFCLDHCADGNGNYSNQVAHVRINDSRLFYSFNDNARELVRNGRFFQSFNVQVAPCNTNIRQLPDEEGMLDSKLQELVQKESTYMDVYNNYKAEVVAMASSMTTPLCRTKRHLEISTMNRHLDGLYSLLQVTRSISMTCNTFVWSLSFLRKFDLSKFDELEECELRWCHQMEHVFYSGQGLNNLRNMKICNLKTLVCFFQGGNVGVFSSLKHLHFEDCPRLQNIMPRDSKLPSLTTLDILFCYSLKTIFFDSGHQCDLYHLPHLQRIRLQELPQLQHLYKDDATIAAPMWKELHVRGCWSLCQLPCLEDQPRMVEVNGERSWWRKLRWASPLHRNSYIPKLPPEFASFDEHAVIKSYLR